MDDSELVLCVSTEHVWNVLPYFEGYRSPLIEGHDGVRSALSELLSADHCLYARRGSCETDPSYKQIIPYVVFVTSTSYPRPASRVFGYRRDTKGGGDKRLQGKLALGVGGHVNHLDSRRDGVPRQLQGTRLGDIWGGISRELAEEVQLGCLPYIPPGIVGPVVGPLGATLVGLLNDDSTDVGKVHLGLAIRVMLTKPQLEPIDPSLTHPCWLRLEDAVSPDDGDAENWTKFMLDNAKEWLIDR